MLCAVAVIALSTSAVQTRIVRYAEKSLCEKLGTKVEIGAARYRFFNNISLNDVYVQSLENDTLAYIGEAKMRFSFLNLFKNRFVVRQLELDNLYGNLKVDSAGTNFDFVINAFKKPKTDTKTSNFVLNINKIEIKNSAFDFKNLKNKNFAGKNNTFNANNLKIKDINAEIVFNFWRADSISAQIKSFSAKEKNGLIISDLTTNATLGKKNINIDFLKINLPNSNINFGKSEIKYDSIAEFQDFNEKILFNIPLENSQIAVNDFAAFVPYFKNIKENFTFSAKIAGTVSNLALRNLTLNYGANTHFAANIETNGLPNIAETFIYSDIQQFSSSAGDVQDFVANLSRQPINLPAKLGKINYKGNISGFLSNLVVYGMLQTAAGNVQTDILLKFSKNLQNLAYSGRIQSKNLQLGQIIENQQIGNIAFDISTTGVKSPQNGFSGKIDGKIIEFDYNNYVYQNLQLAGNYDKRGFEGKAAIEDENINANFTGKIDLTNRKTPIFDFLLNVKDANLQNLNLYTKYPNSTLTFNASTNISGSSLDNMNGFLRLDSIEFINNGKILNINEINISAAAENGQKNIVLNSDFINGKLGGDFSYNSINQTINNFLQQYLPALAAAPDKKQKPSANQLQMDLTFSNLNKISDAFSLPFSFEGNGYLSGNIDEKTNLFSLDAKIPVVYLKSQHIENMQLTINNQNQDSLLLTAIADFTNSKNQTVKFNINAAADNDLIATDLSWKNPNHITNTAHIFFDSQLNKENGTLTARADIKPAQVVLADSLWNIGGSSVIWTADKKLIINKFSVKNAEQFLSINGVASRNSDDKINIELSRLNLDMILKLVGLKGIEFDGAPSGKIEVSSVFSKPIFVANLTVARAAMNKMPIGDGQVFSTYDEPTNSIVINGVFLKQNADTLVVANGNYFIKNDSLDLSFDARGLGIGFLNLYFQNVVKNVDGQGFGKLRLFGKTKNLGFDGDIFVKNGTATVTLLNTTYTFNDSVFLRPKSLYVNNIKLFDNEKNQAFASGALKHTGLFQHPTFDFTIQAKNLLALDTHAGDNDYFFGKIFADGTVQIKGNERVADFNINAVSKPRSKLYIRMQNTFTATDNSFIRFVNHNEKAEIQTADSVKRPEIQMITRVNMQVEATPDAEIELIVDPKSGDLINAKGAGDLRLEFNSRSQDMKLFGTYTISSGYYQFSMQDILRKDFNIETGSSITWSGDLRNANINIRGIYSLSASLRDLLDAADAKTMPANIPVNCVLHLTDNLMSPTITLNLELPQSDATVQQIVKNVVNTQEMMNREIASLLLFGRFYKPEYLSTNTQPISGNDAMSFGFATLNGLISRFMQNNDFSLGFTTNVTEQSQEVISAINYQHNDRLVINGNFGYQNDVLLNSTRLIYDFDIDYKLTKNGKWLFRAYNHSVDRQGSPKQSQGVGIAYREEFNSVGEMMSYYWKKLTGSGKGKK